MTITLPSMKVLAPGVPFSAAAVNAAIRQQRVNLQNIVNGVTGFEKLTWVNSAATLATDTLDLTSKTRVVVVDTEGAAATDNLSTISNGTAYQTLWLKAADVGRVITVKHGVGNIKLWSAVDGTLSSTNWLQLFYDGTQWSDGALPVTYPQNFVINTARTVLGANATSVTISSIPATYQHLLLILELSSDSASSSDGALLRFNADTTSGNYYTQYSLGFSTVMAPGEEPGSVSGIRLTNCVKGSTGGGAGNGQCIVFIKNYASTTMRRTVTYNTYLHSTATASMQSGVGGGDWTNTAAAISSITFAPQTGTNIITGSAYTLYGLN